MAPELTERYQHDGTVRFTLPPNIYIERQQGDQGNQSVYILGLDTNVSGPLTKNLMREYKSDREQTHGDMNEAKLKSIISILINSIRPVSTMYEVFSIRFSANEIVGDGFNDSPRGISIRFKDQEVLKRTIELLLEKTTVGDDKEKNLRLEDIMHFLNLEPDKENLTILKAKIEEQVKDQEDLSSALWLLEEQYPAKKLALV